MKSAAAPRRNPRQLRAKITVDAILDAATRVFVEQGYARSSTNRIAESAGVSVGSLYQYFPDKSSILSALHERHLTGLMAAMTLACRTHQEGELEPTLHAIIAAAAGRHRAHLELVRLFTEQLPAGSGPPRACTTAFQRELLAVLIKHQGQLRLVDRDLALFMLRSLGRSLMESAAQSRPRDLANGMMVRELLAAVMAFLTGERNSRRNKPVARLRKS